MVFSSRRLKIEDTKKTFRNYLTFRLKPVRSEGNLPDLVLRGTYKILQYLKAEPARV